MPFPLKVIRAMLLDRLKRLFGAAEPVAIR
jgi:hypothetical protein